MIKIKEKRLGYRKEGMISMKGMKKLRKMLTIMLVVALSLSQADISAFAAGTGSDAAHANSGVSTSGSGGGSGGSSIVLSYTGGYKISFVYVGKDKYHPQKDMEKTALYADKTPYGMVGAAKIKDTKVPTTFTDGNGKYTGMYGIAPIYFVNDNGSYGEYGASVNSKGEFKLGYVDNAVNNRVVTKDDIKSAYSKALKAYPGTKMGDSNNSSAIWGAFTLKGTGYNMNGTETIGDMSSIMTCIDRNALEKNPTKYANTINQNKIVMSTILNVMIDKYSTNSKIKSILNEYGKEALDSDGEKEFVLLIEPMFTIRRSGKCYLVSATSYELACSCNSTDSEKLKDWPIRTANYEAWRTGNTKKAKYPYNTKYGRANAIPSYGAGYVISNLSSKGPNGRIFSTENTKLPEALVTKVSYAGWMDHKQGEEYRRSVGFISGSSREAWDDDDYKWGFGCLASTDYVPVVAKDAVQASTSVSLITGDTSQQSVPIMNAAYQGDPNKLQDKVDEESMELLKTIEKLLKSGKAPAKDTVARMIYDSFSLNSNESVKLSNKKGEEKDWKSLSSSEKAKCQKIAMTLFGGYNSSSSSLTTEANINKIKYLYLYYSAMSNLNSTKTDSKLAFTTGLANQRKYGELAFIQYSKAGQVNSGSLVSSVASSKDTSISAIAGATNGSITMPTLADEASEAYIEGEVTEGILVTGNGTGLDIINKTGERVYASERNSISKVAGSSSKSSTTNDKEYYIKPIATYSATLQLDPSSEIVTEEFNNKGGVKII